MSKRVRSADPVQEANASRKVEELNQTQWRNAASPERESEAVVLHDGQRSRSFSEARAKDADEDVRVLGTAAHWPHGEDAWKAPGRRSVGLLGKKHKLRKNRNSPPQFLHWRKVRWRSKVGHADDWGESEPPAYANTAPTGRFRGGNDGGSAAASAF